MNANAQDPRLPWDEVILVLDFGSQTTQLIARRIREVGVCSWMVAPDISAAEVRKFNPRGLILSGGPASVYAGESPHCDPAIFDLDIPVLGICYGMQETCRVLGCEVAGAPSREFGRALLEIDRGGGLLNAIPSRTTVWMSHGD
ncbi:MAG: GMP synthase (glutamine-hydrolyzing), partial [Phycisphaerales bacterium]|nr:GMP synthase (glutamine-hydrolyzing) [Phycisphaerales bacterium]